MNMQRRRHTRAAGWLALVLLASGLPASAHRIVRQFRVGSHPVVTVRNASGRVHIRTWRKAEVRVVADHRSPKVEVDATQQGNRVEVATHVLTEDVSPADVEANYEITVPEETELSLRNDSGSVHIEHVIGDLTVETVAAPIELKHIIGYVNARTVGGNVTCEECSGRLEASSISGDIRILRSQSPNVQARTSTGNILLDSDLLPNGLYTLRNYSGQIEVRFSPSDSFDVSAISMRGQVENEAELKQPSHISHHLPAFARSLFGVYNEGRARLVLTSFSGTIRIRRRM